MSDHTPGNGTHGQPQGAESRESGDPARQDGEQGAGAGDIESVVARVLGQVLPKALNGAVKTYVSREIAKIRKPEQADDAVEDDGSSTPSKPSAADAEVAKLRREMKTLQDSIVAKERQAAEKERHSRLVSKLSTADAVDPERVARMLAPELKIDDNGNWVGEDENGSPLTLDEAVAAFFKSNSWAKKQPKGAPGGGSVGSAKHGGSGLPANATYAQKLEFGLAQRK